MVIDPYIELKWIDKRMDKLQQALLQMEHDKKMLDIEIARGNQELEELRARRIRVGAIIEEQKKANVKGDVSAGSEKGGDA